MSEFGANHIPFTIMKIHNLKMGKPKPVETWQPGDLEIWSQHNKWRIDGRMSTHTHTHTQTHTDTHPHTHNHSFKYNKHATQYAGCWGFIEINLLWEVGSWRSVHVWNRMLLLMLAPGPDPIP